MELAVCHSSPFWCLEFCLVDFWIICVPLAYATQKLSSVKVLNYFWIFFRNDSETGRQGNVARQRNMKRRKSAKGWRKRIGSEKPRDSKNSWRIMTMNVMMQSITSEYILSAYNLCFLISVLRHLFAATLHLSPTVPYVPQGSPVRYFSFSERLRLIYSWTSWPFCSIQ